MNFLNTSAQDHFFEMNFAATTKAKKNTNNGGRESRESKDNDDDEQFESGEFNATTDHKPEKMISRFLQAHKLDNKKSSKLISLCGVLFLAMMMIN